mgnify:CR=1 FL=1
MPDMYLSKVKISPEREHQQGKRKECHQPTSQQQIRDKQAIADDEDYKVGQNLAPSSQNINQTDMFLRHHLRV